MISVIITLLMVLVVSWAVSRICNQRIEGCVPIVLMGTMLLLYIFYLFNLLVAGRILVYVVFAALVIYAVIRTVKEKSRSAAGEILTPAIVLFLCLAAAYVIFSI